jgi:hypothetical protein
MPRFAGILLLIVVLCPAAFTAHAAEIGHFNGGILNIRDYFVPEPGLYGGLYNYFYHTAGSTTAMATTSTPSPSIPAAGRGSRWGWTWMWTCMRSCRW